MSAGIPSTQTTLGLGKTSQQITPGLSGLTKATTATAAQGTQLSGLTGQGVQYLVAPL